MLRIDKLAGRFFMIGALICAGPTVSADIITDWNNIAIHATQTAGANSLLQTRVLAMVVAPGRLSPTHHEPRSRWPIVLPYWQRPWNRFAANSSAR
jgi:hypothetical protein